MIKYDVKSNVLSIGADILAFFACPHGDIERRATSAARHTPEGARAAKEIAHSAKSGFERSPVICHSVTLDSLEYCITCTPDAIINDASGITVELHIETRGETDFASVGDLPQKEAEGIITAFFLSLKNGKIPISVKISRINYFTGNVCSREQGYSFAELENRLREILKAASQLTSIFAKTKTEGYTLAESIKFPYADMRSGQRDFINEAYSAIRRGERLLVNAPTGIGKTMSALYPAIKALKKCDNERIFYFTSKGTAARAALSALSTLSEQGLKIRAIGLSAKERLCSKLHRGKCPAVCSAECCSYAKGHFTRLKDAISSLLSLWVITPEDILKTAELYRVCPYELSLDTSLFCSVIVCDYNYLFDPSAYLRRYFPGSKNDSVFLLDEAHNLPDRVRSMYTKEFSSDLLESLLHAPDTEHRLSFRQAAINVKSLMMKLRKLCAENTHIDAKGIEYGATAQSQPLGNFSQALEKLQFECDKLLLHPEQLSSEVRASVTALQRAAHEYILCEGLIDNGAAYTVLYRGESTQTAVRCLDPSETIDEKLSYAKSAVLFSATLEPMEYFAHLTGCSDCNMLKLPSPYERENFCVAVMDKISTRYEHREATLSNVLDVIVTTVGAKSGNYFVFSPSYEYSRKICDAFVNRMPAAKVLCQSSGMTYSERQKFLSEFEIDDGGTTVGFCVMGGVFSESVDLPGKKLIGCIIIGNGAGAVTPERELLQEYYQNKYENGYEYAYTYPGMNRVLQAAGRVIRDEHDRGIAVLIDDRYSSQVYRSLMPEHWHSLKYVGNKETLAALLRNFWEKTKK